MAVVVATVLMAAPLSAQGVAGTVRAAGSAEPLPGVRVEVVEAARKVDTDAGGVYRVDRLAPGEYTVRATVPGRAVKSERVRVEAGATTRLDLELDAPPIHLAAVNVLLQRTRMVDGRLAPVAGSAHQVGVTELRAAGRMVDDVHSVLRTVPGVNVQEEDGYGLRPNIGIRGTGVSRSSKVSVMEDGVPVAPAPYSAPAAYIFPVAGRMEGVEIRKGSSQVKYGPWTTGGAINFVTATIPETLRLAADVSGGDHGSRKLRASAGDAGRHFGWLAETYQIKTDGFKALDGGAPTGFELRDWFVKLRANTSPDAHVYQELELKLTRTDERSDETYLGLTDHDFRATPLRRYAGSQQDVMDVGQRKYALRHFIQPSARVDVTTTFYLHDYARGWYKLDGVGGRGITAVLDAPDQFADELAILRGADSPEGALRVRANNRDYDVRGVQSVLGIGFEAGGRHALQFGVRLHEDSESRFQHDDGYTMSSGRMMLAASGAPGTQANQKAEARAVALFVEDQIGVGAWTLTPGVRFESIRFTRRTWGPGDVARATPIAVAENGVDVIIPGIGLTRRVGATFVAFGGVHKGFGPPGPGADEEARAEESLNYELGFRWHRGWAGAQVAAFYNDYTNILGRATLAVGESGAGDLFNGGSVRARGIEIAADYDAATLLGFGTRAPLSAAYTWTDAQFMSAFESGFDSWGSVRPGDRLPYLPEHQLHVGVGFETARTAVRASAVHASAMRTRAGRGPIPADEGTDSFIIFNAAAELGVTRDARFYVGVQNLADRRYVVARRPAGARPGLPRTVSAGLRFAWR
jgi:Fe(3+) dicitrate transport protein